MKILFLLDWHLNYAIELANALTSEHEILFVTRDHNYEISSPERPTTLDDFLKKTLSKGIRKEKLRYRRRDLRNLSEIRRICSIAEEFNPDIVHIQETSDWRFFLIVKKLGFQKAILTVHDVNLHPGHKKQALNMVSRYLRNKSSKIIVHGIYLKQFLKKTGAVLEENIYVIPHGAYSIYKNWDDGSVREEGNVVLFFGYIRKYKGIEVLVEAQPYINQEIPDAKILIVGKGDGLEKYADFIIGNPHFEIINAFIPSEDVFKYFRRAGVVVLPYIEASQSGVLPLAYAFGKPVVATDVGSIAEVVENGKTGFVVPPNDPGKLAEAVVTILKDPELRSRMGRNAAEKAATDLSWKTIAAETLRVYASMIRHE